METVMITGLVTIAVALIGFGGVVVGKMWDRHNQVFKEVATLKLKSGSGPHYVVPSCNDHHDKLGAIPRCYVRVALTPKGSPHGAKDCQIQLKEIWRQGGGVIARINYPNMGPLQWNGEGGASGTFQKRSLAHSEDQIADLIFTRVINGETSVVLKDNKYTNVGLEMNNTYFFSLMAQCTNGNGTPKILQVTLGTSYKDIKVVTRSSLAFQFLKIASEMRSNLWGQIPHFASNRLVQPAS